MSLLSNIFLTIIAVLSSAFAILSMMYVFKKKELEQQERDAEELINKNKELKSYNEVMDQMQKTNTEEKKANEELLQNAQEPSLNGFNAGVELLQKLSKK